MSIEERKIKVDAAKKGWDWAMNFCNNLCVQISDDYNNDDNLEQADAAYKCYLKIQANMGYYPPEIEAAEWQGQAAIDLQLPVLERAKQNMQWMWDNLHLPHTADHFNIPANAIKELEDLIIQIKR